MKSVPLCWVSSRSATRVEICTVLDFSLTISAVDAPALGGWRCRPRPGAMPAGGHRTALGHLPPVSVPGAAPGEPALSAMGKEPYILKTVFGNECHLTFGRERRVPGE